jgi:phosphinothricin acetyltransferase
MDVKIRKVAFRDKDSIISIFNYYVENSFAAYPEIKVGDEFFDRLKNAAYNDSFFVIENTDSGVIGFGLLKKYHTADTLKRSAELTYFLHHEYLRYGLGTNLLEVLYSDAKSYGVKTVLAHISSLNEISINFHLKNGFTECGRFKNVGKKFGKEFDVVWGQKFL